MKQKVVFRLNISSDKKKNKVMKTAIGISGVESVSFDMKDQKLTVVGEGLDSVFVVIKLRKLCGFAEIYSVGPTEIQEEKKDEFKKTEEKEVPEFLKAYIAFNPHMRMIELAQEDRREGGA